MILLGVCVVGKFHTTADITPNITFYLYNEILNNIAYKGSLEVGKENSNDVQNFRHVKMRKKKIFFWKHVLLYFP